MKQKQENYQHVKTYDEKSVNNGYDCSCADPFLFLISELLEVNIEHKYNGVLIKYNRTNSTQNIVKEISNYRTLRFTSNRTHFSFINPLKV